MNRRTILKALALSPLACILPAQAGASRISFTPECLHVWVSETRVLVALDADDAVKVYNAGTGTPSDRSFTYPGEWTRWDDHQPLTMSEPLGRPQEIKVGLTDEEVRGGVISREFMYHAGLTTAFTTAWPHWWVLGGRCILRGSFERAGTRALSDLLQAGRRCLV